ncbi:MAG: hypothetical protein M3619_25420 [Myxococcota bacterium]|nr:hypothetical protein [Myxococcota bacterium]
MVSSVERIPGVVCVDSYVAWKDKKAMNRHAAVLLLAATVALSAVHARATVYAPQDGAYLLALRGIGPFLAYRQGVTAWFQPGIFKR